MDRQLSSRRVPYDSRDVRLNSSRSSRQADEPETCVLLGPTLQTRTGLALGDAHSVAAMAWTR